MLKFKKGSSGTLTTIDVVKFKKGSNSLVALTDLIINGTHVWCEKPAFSTYHTMMSQASGSVIISLIIKNNSNRNVSFTVSSLGASSKTVNIAGNSSSACGLTFDSTPSTTITWTVKYLGYSDMVRTTLGNNAI